MKVIHYYIMTIVSYILAVVIMIVAIRACCVENKDNNKIPVEESDDINHLVQENDSIKLKVESLDSIKNAKVIEVIALDNDSTIKLFYELVSE